MPPIFLHMALANDIGGLLAPAAPSSLNPIHHETGAYLLGATTPDIRVLTRGDRRDTHFFDFSIIEHQDTVTAFLATYGHLAAPENLDEQTIAFVLGYITHLVFDERYIETMYRPHFGQLSALGGSDLADLMDRMLQFELDRRRRERLDEVDQIREALAGCSLRLDVGFLDSETLRRWQQVAIDLTRHPPDWERFKFQGGRHLRQAWVEQPDGYARFLERVPELLQQTIDHVSTAQVDSFLDKSRQIAATTMQRYLACA